MRRVVAKTLQNLELGPNVVYCFWGSVRIWYVRIFFGETVSLIVLSTWIFSKVSTVSFARVGAFILDAFKHYGRFASVGVMQKDFKRINVKQV